MPRQEFRFDPPERFVAGTVGEPGQRTFFLQARSGPRITSVVCEKQQVSVLADRMDALLDEVLRRSGGAAPVPALPPAGEEDRAPLEQPIVEEFRVGTLTLAWDAEAAEVVVEAFAYAEDAEDAEGAAEEATETGATGEPTGDPTGEPAGEPAVPGVSDDLDVLVVRMTGAMARAFARRTRSVVEAGRPACPLCHQPLDPQGHICPRQNGYRRRG